MDMRVLIVEDNQHMSNLIKEYFIQAGYDTMVAETGPSAIEMFNQHEFILVILDIMLPYLDGWTVLKRIRNKSDVAVIALTALDSEEDKLSGFELGIDEYVTKPFSPKVLVARANALINRITSNQSSHTIDEQVLNYGGLYIDKNATKVMVGGNHIELTPKEYKVLLFLVENKNITLSREQILDKIWGYEFYGDLRVVDTHIKNLRKKIANHADKIKTVTGTGYRFEEEL